MELVEEPPVELLISKSSLNSIDPFPCAQQRVTQLVVNSRQGAADPGRASFFGFVG